MSKWLKMFYYFFPELQLVISGVGEFADLHNYIQKRYEQAEENYKQAKNKENKKILEREEILYTDFINIYIDMYITKKSSPLIFFEKDEMFEEVTGKKIRGIYVNSKALRDYKASENFHAQGCNNIDGVIVRELCRIVDSMFVVSGMYRTEELYERLLFSEELSSKICDSVIPPEKDKKLFKYRASIGNDSVHFVKSPKRIEYYKKFVAEALAEYFMSESPREVAMKVGDFMFRQYEGYKAGVIDSRSILS